MKSSNWLTSRLRPATATLLAIAVVVFPGCGGGDDSLTVYSGRSSTLVQPLLDAFSEDTGLPIRVKYAGSSEIVATILEEGGNSPADVVLLQDPGSLGALEQADLLNKLPDDLLEMVAPTFRSPRGEWVGTSGRVRTVVYNTSAVDPEQDLPDSILGFTAPEWKGRVGWAPLNGSFQAFVTALRVQQGEAVARQWLEGMKANDARPYPKNTPIVAAVASGEVDVGFVNHYYLERFLEEEGEGFGARNYFLGSGDPGALVLVAGAGILKSSGSEEAAREFIGYLLSASAQQYFSAETKEYPLIAGVEPEGSLPPLKSLSPPELDLGDLSDLRGTQALLRDVGLIQ